MLESLVVATLFLLLTLGGYQVINMLLHQREAQGLLNEVSLRAQDVGGQLIHQNTYSLEPFSENISSSIILNKGEEQLTALGQPFSFKITGIPRSTCETFVEYAEQLNSVIDIVNMYEMDDENKRISFKKGNNAKSICSSSNIQIYFSRYLNAQNAEAVETNCYPPCIYGKCVENMCHCDPGYYFDAQAGCIACGPGYATKTPYSGATSCALCGPREVSTDKANSECQSCEEPYPLANDKRTNCRSIRSHEDCMLVYSDTPVYDGAGGCHAIENDADCVALYPNDSSKAHWNGTTCVQCTADAHCTDKINAPVCLNQVCSPCPDETPLWWKKECIVDNTCSYTVTEQAQEILVNECNYIVTEQAQEISVNECNYIITTQEQTTDENGEYDQPAVTITVGKQCADSSKYCFVNFADESCSSSVNNSTTGTLWGACVPRTSNTGTCGTYDQPAATITANKTCRDSDKYCLIQWTNYCTSTPDSNVIGILWGTCVAQNTRTGSCPVPE